MQNIQCLMYLLSANKYIYKYIGIMNDCNSIVVSNDTHKNEILIAQSTFLHNIKLSTSASNDTKTMEKEKKRNRSKGRVIILIEMIQMMLLYGEVCTDMFFIHINSSSYEGLYMHST